MSTPMKLRALLIGLLLTVGSTVGAFAQCSGSAPASTYCGNPTGALALPGWKPFSGIPFPNIAGGTVVGNRGSAIGAGAPLTNPILGIPGTSTGEIGLAGSGSGTATLRAQAAAGSPILLLPNTSGTLASSASSPLVLSATTGALTCPTCVTSSGGGAITGTPPISVSAAGVVSINAPYTTLTANNGGIVYSGATNLAILSGTATARQMLQSGASATPAWSTTTWPATTTINRLLFSSAANVITDLATANGGVLNTSSGGVPSITNAPVLGVAGSSVGSIGFQNATSGTATLQPVTGALGAPTILIPAASGTMAVSVSAPITLNATTGALACATCVTSAAGGAGVALTKTDDTNVTMTLGGSPTTALVNAASMTLGWTGQLSIGRGGTGQATAPAAITALMPTPTRAGDISYWNGTIWTTLAGNNSGTNILTENASGVPSWAASGSVSSVTIAAGTGINVAGTCVITTSGVCTISVNQSVITNSLSSNVAIATGAGFTDGPSVAQGTSGTWWVSGGVVVSDTAGNNDFKCKLWDGTTVIDSTVQYAASANKDYNMPLSGYLASPAANIRISCNTSAVGATTTFRFNDSGASKDSTVSAHRVQ